MNTPGSTGKQEEAWTVIFITRMEQDFRTGAREAQSNPARVEDKSSPVETGAPEPCTQGAEYSSPQASPQLNIPAPAEMRFSFWRRGKSLVWQKGGGPGQRSRKDLQAGQSCCPCLWKGLWFLGKKNKDQENLPEGDLLPPTPKKTWWPWGTRRGGQHDPKAGPPARWLWRFWRKNAVHPQVPEAEELEPVPTLGSALSAVFIIGSSPETSYTSWTSQPGETTKKNPEELGQMSQLDIQHLIKTLITLAAERGGDNEEAVNQEEDAITGVKGRGPEKTARDHHILVMSPPIRLWGQKGEGL
ncbi:uncharacterized protein LOC112550561 [Alligator sinensis]|uniref:Uncharacterized protein LOC112550561 n=1 Tax=Alligator sinensis TaxID=38654 RepID=A0A3Q0GUY7_ALLSI|nr:uncharacterized protein LOC112550561 [Alligator sinensis]